MGYDAARTGSILAIVLLMLAMASPAYAQARSREDNRQETQNKIDCVLCKITELLIMVAIPVILLASLPAALLGLALLLFFYDKMKKSKDAAAKHKAKKVLIVLFAVMGIFLTIAAVAAVLLFAGVIGGGCSGACSGVFQQ
jgi:uncharacterized membrane protein